MNKQKPLIDLAIIIPTLNEEHFVGFLLDSILNQTVLPKEVVVVDANSEDGTLSEIKKRQKIFDNLKVFNIPKYTISRQRNFGVKQTSSSNLLFLDADTELRERDVLERYLEHVQKKDCDLAVATNVPTTNYWKDVIYFKAVDFTFRIFKPIWPMATSINMFIKREMFERVGGFDERVAVGEDFEIVNRIVKKEGKFILLREPKIHTSARRVRKEGRIRFALKALKSFIQIVRYGFRNNNMEYEFGHFTKRDQQKKL